MFIALEYFKYQQLIYICKQSKHNIRYTLLYRDDAADGAACFVDHCTLALNS
jgi:hypothetical protein